MVLKSALCMVPEIAEGLASWFSDDLVHLDAKVVVCTLCLASMLSDVLCCTTFTIRIFIENPARVLNWNARQGQGRHLIAQSLSVKDGMTGGVLVLLGSSSLLLSLYVEPCRPSIH